MLYPRSRHLRQIPRRAVVAAGLREHGLRLFKQRTGALAVAGAEQILKREVNAAAHADLLSQLSTEL